MLTVFVQLYLSPAYAPIRSDWILILFVSIDTNGVIIADGKAPYVLVGCASTFIRNWATVLISYQLMSDETILTKVKDNYTLFFSTTAQAEFRSCSGFWFFTASGVLFSLCGSNFRLYLTACQEIIT